MSSNQAFTVGSDNMYADLGLVEPELELAKAQLARQIGGRIRDRKLTQKQAAVVLGLDQPTVSRLLRGRLGIYSIERLMQLVTRLDADVEIRVIPKEPARSSGHITVRPDADHRETIHAGDWPVSG
jgi:predicted XRE-type DNA-binding protein